MRTPWIRDHFRQVHMDFHMPEFPANAIKRFNPVSFAENLVRGKVNMVALFAKCHFGNSFYNTKVGHKHSGLPNDFLMEAATECRKRGIKTLAYLSVSWDQRAFRDHPQWRFINEDGQEVADTPVTQRVCMNTGYRQEFLGQVEEICDYPVDGFFLDIPHPYYWGKNHCACASCKELYRQKYGREMPGKMGWHESDTLAMKTMVDWLGQMRSIINRKNPSLIICANSFGTYNVSKEVNELVELGVWESQPSPGDYLGHSFSSRTARNDINDVQIMTVRFYEGWGDLTLKPAPQLKTEFAIMLANGMPACAGDQVNVDGTLQSPVYDTFADAFGFVEARENVLRDADSIRHTVIVWPTPDPEAPYAVGGREGWDSYYSSLRGAHKILTESHIQNDIIYSLLLKKDLSEYPVLILPGANCFQPGFTRKLRQYVEGGGILIAAGESLIEDGKFGLSDLFGLSCEGANEYKIAHFTPVDSALAEGLPAIPLQHRGPSWLVKPTTARELAALFFPQVQGDLPDKSFRHPSCPPAMDERSPYSYCTIHDCGKGKAIYIAGSIFEVYWKTNHHWLRRFVENVIRHGDANCPYETDASGRIEMNLMRRGHDLLLNLVNYSLGHQGGGHAIAGIEKVDAVHNVRCSVRVGQIARVALEPEGVEIPFEFDKGVCTFTIPKIESLAIVQLENAAP